MVQWTTTLDDAGLAGLVKYMGELWAVYSVFSCGFVQLYGVIFDASFILRTHIDGNYVERFGAAVGSTSSVFHPHLASRAVTEVSIDYSTSYGCTIWDAEISKMEETGVTAI